MTFIIGRGFAECQILKKWKWPYLLNWVEYFDKLLCKHWYWQDLVQEWNIVMKFCIHIDIDKISWNILNILIKLFSGMDRYEDFLRLKIHLNQNIKVF